jgi:Kef-type K+ transport system membrane component KefB
MFTIGLEFSLPRLFSMKRIVFGLGPFRCWRRSCW